MISSSAKTTNIWCSIYLKLIQIFDSSPKFYFPQDCEALNANVQKYFSYRVASCRVHSYRVPLYIYIYIYFYTGAKWVCLDLCLYVWLYVCMFKNDVLHTTTDANWLTTTDRFGIRFFRIHILQRNISNGKIRVFAKFRFVTHILKF